VPRVTGPAARRASKASPEAHFNEFLTRSPFSLVTFSTPEVTEPLPDINIESRPIVALAIVALLGFWSCGTVAPATKAAEVERLQCDGTSSTETDARLIEGMTVLSVEPLYSYVHTATTGTDKRVAGVKLLIRPPESVDADRVLRVLQCHGARAVLGRVDASRFPDDPYWLNGYWLDIDLVPESGNLSITVQADDIHKNLQVLSRAKAFAAAHARLQMPVPPPPTHQG